jgi:hypothetical protein
MRREIAFHCMTTTIESTSLNKVRICKSLDLPLVKAHHWIKDSNVLCDIFQFLLHTKCEIVLKDQRLSIRIIAEMVNMDKEDGKKNLA